jgi:hypothetical protein
MRLSPAQKRVMAALWGGAFVRRRGVFGDYQAPALDARFAASRTIDILWKAGLIEPAPFWGAFQATKKKAAE